MWAIQCFSNITQFQRNTKKQKCILEIHSQYTLDPIEKIDDSTGDVYLGSTELVQFKLNLGKKYV